MAFLAFVNSGLAAVGDSESAVRRVPVKELRRTPSEAAAPGDSSEGKRAPAETTEPEADRDGHKADPEPTGERRVPAPPEPEDADYEISSETVYAGGDRGSRLSGASASVGGAMLERFEEDDIHAVLVKVPGVNVREEDGYGLRPNIGMRGSSTNRSAKLTLMEDGMLFAPAPYAAPAAYYFPLLTRMSEVDVYKGASILRFGPSTIAGALNLVTRPIPSAPVGEVDIALGRTLFEPLAGDDWNRKLHAYAGTSDAHFGVLVEGVRLERSGFKTLNVGGNPSDTGYERSEVMLKLRGGNEISPGVDGLLELKLGYATELSNETYLGLSDADFAENPYQRYAASQLGEMNWSRFQAALTGFLTFGESADLTLTGYHAEFDRAWRKFDGFVGQGIPTVEAILRDPTGLRRPYYEVLTGARDSTDAELLAIGNNQRSYVSQGVQAALRIRAERGRLSNELELGARLHQDRVTRHHTAEDMFMRHGELVRSSGEVHATLDNEGRAQAWSLYGMNQLTLGRLGLLPGVRLEYIATELEDLQSGKVERDDAWAILPGVGLTWAFTEQLFALAGVHRGYSPKAPGQPSEVLPETSWNYEAGARYVAPEGFFEAVVFANDYGNLTGDCTLAVGCTADQLGNQFNGGRVIVMGLELAALGEIQTRGSLRFPYSLAYTYTQSEFLTSFDSGNPEFGEVQAGDELPYVPNHQGSVGVGVATDVWGLNLSASYVSRTRETAGYGPIEDFDAADAHLLLDFSGSYAPMPWLEMYVTVQNLTNETYVASHRPMGARPGAPRSAMFGTKIAF